MKITRSGNAYPIAVDILYTLYAIKNIPLNNKYHHPMGNYNSALRTIPELFEKVIDEVGLYIARLKDAQINNPNDWQDYIGRNAHLWPHQERLEERMKLLMYKLLNYLDIIQEKVAYSFIPKLQISKDDSIQPWRILITRPINKVKHDSSQLQFSSTLWKGEVVPFFRIVGHEKSGHLGPYDKLFEGIEKQPEDVGYTLYDTLRFYFWFVHYTSHVLNDQIIAATGLQPLSQDLPEQNEEWLHLSRRLARLPVKTKDLTRINLQETKGTFRMEIDRMD